MNDLIKDLNLYCGKDYIADNILDWQNERGISFEETKRAFRDIYTYGKPILESEEFIAAFSQTHHIVLTVGEHLLHVTLYSLHLSYAFLERGYKVNLRDVVRAGLCHDLGILGRYEKFSNNAVCCFNHPLDSVVIARKLLPDLSKKTAIAIARHMFPLTIIPPLSLTGYILIKSDKICAFYERLDYVKQLIFSRFSFISA